MIQQKTRKLSRNTLQFIAMITMVIDHINTVFFQLIVQIFLKPGYTVEDMIVYSNFCGLLYAIGRIAFPIFAFLIADGCLRTRNIKKYAIRLAICAVLSEFCYDFAFNLFNLEQPVQSLSDFIAQFRPASRNNVLFSLLASVLFIMVIQHVQQQTSSRIIAAIQLILSGTGLYLFCMILQAEYWEICIPMITLLYLLKRTSIKLIVSSIFLYGFYFVVPIFQSMRWESFSQAISGSVFYNFDLSDAFLVIGVAIAILLISLYNSNGKPRNSRWIYWFYPGHLLVLGLLRDLYVIFA